MVKMVVCNTKEVSSELLPFLRVFKDGSVERFISSPFAPPIIAEDINVSSKDVQISPHVSARIYLPKPSKPNQKLPILAYFHGGGFCIESAFSFLSHRYITAVASVSKALIVSIEYRLAPENPLPTAYQDAWTAIQWIASQNENWIQNYANFDRFFVGGDSSGANLAHYITMRAGLLGGNGIKIFGTFLSFPYFLGSQPIDTEPIQDHDKTLLYKTWQFVYPNAENGFDNPLINPISRDAPSLSWLGCSRLLVCVAEKDELRSRGKRYFDVLKKSGWKGKAELFEVEDEDHCFQIFDLHSDNGKIMIKRLASFLGSSSKKN